MAQEVGALYYDLNIKDDKLKSQLGNAEDSVKNFGEHTSNRLGMLSAGFETLGKIGVGAALAVGAAVTLVLVKNMDKAIQRIDTLNNFPNVMKNLGYSVDDSTTAIKKLESGVKGLPTSLSDIASAMQNIAPSSKSLDEATNLTLALNNALIAGGKPAAIQASAMEQFSQAISKGKPDMMEWRTLATAMPGQLDQIGRSLGYGRGQWQKMASDVTDGILPFDKVKGAIVALNNEGLGKFPSFAQQAKNASGGLQTAMANANTAIARGIANVITAIGSTNISSAIVRLGDLLEKALKSVSKGITDFTTYLRENQGAMYAFTGAAIGLGVALLVALAPAIWGVVAAIGAAALAAAPFILAGAAIAGIVYVIKQNWEALSPIVDRVTAGFKYFWEMIKPLRDFVADQFKKAWDDLKAAFDQLMVTLAPFMPQLKILGMILLAAVVAPIVIVIGVIGLLVAAGIVVISFIARLIGWLAQLGAWFTNLGVSISQSTHNFLVSVGNAVNGAVGWFAGLPGRILGAIGNLGGLLYNVGAQVVQGFINGIVHMFGNVKGTLQSLTAKLTSWKGPEQVDKRILFGAGSMVIDGFVTGLESQYKNVKTSLSNFTDGLSANVTLGADVVQQGFNQQPILPAYSSETITPTNNTSSTVNIQNVNIDSEQTADYFFAKLGRNQELTTKGLATTPGSVG
jgi:tape measure domain-containing protein